MCKSHQTQVQVQIQQDEAYWRKRLEELGAKFDEIVVEVLNEDYRHRNNPYEPIVNAVSQYIYDVASKLYGLVDSLNNLDGLDGKGVLHALAKLEDIANDMSAFVNSIRKMVRACQR
jgi:hypothetical protein